MTTKAERIAILVRAVEASIRGDSTVVAELFTDDARGWASALEFSSAVQLAVEFEDRAGAFSDLELSVSPLDVTGTTAAVEWVARMSHTGPLVLVDDSVIHPTGVRLIVHGVSVAEFAGSRIRSFRQYWDDASLFEQLGLVPEAS